METTGYLLCGILLNLAIVEVQPRCMWGDMRYPPNKEVSPLPACGKCRCIPIGNDEFKWSCPDNSACEKHPVVLICFHNGDKVHAGNSILLSDGCTNCTCKVGGNLTCTNSSCQSPPPPQIHNPPVRCYHKGRVLRVGHEFFPDTARRCERCSCEKTGRVECIDSCTRCQYNGSELSLGDRVPSVDGCNTCTCEEEARVACTELFCGTTQCIYKGRRYNLGDEFQKAKGDCNTCDCGVDGEVECRNRRCPVVVALAAAAPPAEAKKNQTCQFKGKRYDVGEVWEWADGARAGPQGVERECDTCRCVVYPDNNEIHARWVCTSTCEPPPEREQQMPLWRIMASLLDSIFSRTPHD